MQEKCTTTLSDLQKAIVNDCGRRLQISCAAVGRDLFRIYLNRMRYEDIRQRTKDDDSELKDYTLRGRVYGVAELGDDDTIRQINAMAESRQIPQSEMFQEIIEEILPKYFTWITQSDFPDVKPARTDLDVISAVLELQERMDTAEVRIESLDRDTVKKDALATLITQ